MPRMSLKQLCEYARQRDGWHRKHLHGQIRNSYGECPVVAGYVVVTDEDIHENNDAPELARALGLTIDANSVMDAADGYTPSGRLKRLRTLMLQYLHIEEE